ARLGDGGRALVARPVDDGGGHRLRGGVGGGGGRQGSSGHARRSSMRYSERLVDHFLNPRNAGLMREADGAGSDEYAGCGDLTRFYLKMRAGCLAEARFQAYGCGPTIAAASVATELVAGRAVEDLLLLAAQEIDDAL